jgi:phage-related protein
MSRPIKKIEFNRAAKRDYDELPEAVKDEFGFALWEIQQGLYPGIAKTLKGFSGADVQELKANDPDGTYRAIYTLRLEDTVYVLHAFQKKSHRGRSTDQADIEIVRARLKSAEADLTAIREQRDKEK